MSAIVNATPLIALAVVDQLELLPQVFGDIIVPTAVYDEVIGQGLERPGAQIIAQANWLQVMSPKTTYTIEPLLLGLDQGEIDVLLLARELQPDWVIIDERQARRVARAMGMPVKGTVGVLLTVGLAGLRSKEELLTVLADMIKYGIRIKPQLQAWLKKELSKTK
jgi:predicted nucleic acid-binding protein